MENDSVISTDFGCVPCGQKVVDVIKIENKTKKTQALVVVEKGKKLKNSNEKLHIHPIRALVQPKQTVRFTLTYLSNVEDVTDNFSYDVLDSEKLLTRLNVHAQSVGPCLNPKFFNVKFFCFRDVTQTVKNLEIENTSKCEAKFYFDLDEDSQDLEISQRSGVIHAGLKLGLKLTFNPLEPGVFYKKIFCLVQFHKPIVFNILAIYQPKLKLEPKRLSFRYPPQPSFSCSYEEYIIKSKTENSCEGENSQFFQKPAEEFKVPASDLIKSEEFNTEETKPALPHALPHSEGKYWTDHVTSQIYLTTSFIDIKNSSEVFKATALVNLSTCHLYYFEWDHDSKSHFQIDPCKGLIEPNTKTCFTIYFTPSVSHFLYHIELNVRVFPCNTEPEADSSHLIYLPLTMSLKIIGNSFPDDSCGWIAQCKVTPKTLHLRSCVPDEKVYGTFLIERQGHLPFVYVVVPPQISNFTVHPPLGYLSKSFQLFAVQFNSESLKPGIYAEDLKIKLNNSDSNVETIKIIVSVEKPLLILGHNNSLTFTPIFPGSKVSEKIPIENPTNLHLSYEFKVPEDITWAEVVNPTGLIRPKCFGEVEVIFKPDTPCEYLDYIPCLVSSTSKIDYVETIHLQLIGSCQFGYLVAIPSIYDFGDCIYKEKKTVKINLFNFSSVMIFFKLTVHETIGDVGRDVSVSPSRGCMPAKGSLEVQVTVIPHKIDSLTYEIKCQNFQDDSEEALPCEKPRQILSLQFEGVLPNFQIIDLSIENGGPLFSPHLLWKMLNIDRLNQALRSLKTQEVIEITLPEAERNSPPMFVALLLEASRHGEISWDVTLEIICPCLEASERSFAEANMCVHKKVVTLNPSRRKLGPKKRIVSIIKVNYSYLNECTVQVTIKLPYNRSVIWKMPLVSLPDEGPSAASIYFKSTFFLKSIFIGDAQPPLQLFWLYNNTRKPASYFLDKTALRQATIVEGIFDCINPTGIIPPFSSVPLGFVFSPRELKSYSVEVPLFLQECKKTLIYLVGEGLLNVQPGQEFAIEKTIPKKTKLKNENIALECYENIIYISFLRTFSKLKRFFLIKNNSKTEEWAFHWHNFNVEDIFTATVEPVKGVIGPGQEAFMTLTLESFCYSTYLNFSMPCDITNYSELKDYEASVQIYDKMLEKAKDYFTINEKGTTYEIPDIQINKKPEPYHIFVSVSANIVSGLNIDQKLTQKQQSVLRAENEMESYVKSDYPLSPTVLPSFQELFEKLLWNVLCSNNVSHNIESSQKSQDYTYLQMIPESKKKSQDYAVRLMALPHKNHIQRFLERRTKEILYKNFISEENQVNQFTK